MALVGVAHLLTKNDPIERLPVIRRTMLQTETSFGASTDRPDYPENSRWRMGRVLFVIVNVPGATTNTSPTRTSAAPTASSTTSR